MGQLSFYTTGEAMNNLVFSFLKEGKFSLVEEILIDGGIEDPDIIKNFFLKKYEFKGDTRDEGIMLTPSNVISVNEDLYFSFINIKHGLEFLEKGYEELKDVKTLFKYIPKEDFIKRTYKYFLKYNGFTLIPFGETVNRRYLSGVILQSGELVVCQEQQHSSLYVLLKRLGFASTSDWVNDTRCIHISCCQVSAEIEFYGRKHIDYDYTLLQLISLYNHSDYLKMYNGRNVAYTIYRKFIDYIDQGGKYGGLEFLKTFEPLLFLPKFSLLKEELKGELLVRTSPKFSLPGLLQSRKYKGPETISQIENEFEQYKDVVKNNTLNYFFQEYKEGVNGVLQYLHASQELSYAHNIEQGAIVKGKENDSSYVLEELFLDRIKNICSKFDQDIQIEYVITEEVVYILQFRILPNKAEQTIQLNKPENCLIEGLTFSKGSIDVNVEDILIVDSEADSNLLLGKKALIVKDKKAFSHILALSRMLGIPSMYNTGEVNLPNNGIVQFVAYNTQSWVINK